MYVNYHATRAANVKMNSECEINETFCKVSEIKMVNENTEVDDDGSEEILLKELVSPGTIAAVRAADDIEYDYYLIEANNFSQVLRKETADSWGASFCSGTEIIRCHYFNKLNSNSLRYKLLTRRPAIVPSRSLVYICQEVDLLENELVLPEDVHLRILRSLQSY